MYFYYWMLTLDLRLCVCMCVCGVFGAGLFFFFFLTDYSEDIWMEALNSIQGLNTNSWCHEFLFSPAMIWEAMWSPSKLLICHSYCAKVNTVSKLLSHVWLFATSRTVARQAPLSMGFFKQEYWSGLQCPPAEDLLHPGIKPGFPALQADLLLPEPPGKPDTT